MNWNAGNAWYGEDAAAPATTDADAPARGAVLQELIPVAASFVKEFQDPYRRVELSKARLANARARGASANRIRVLEARYRAALTQVGLEGEELTSVRRYRGLGQAALVSAIVVAASLTILLLSKAAQTRS
jgi:hypothetical protein